MSDRWTQAETRALLEKVGSYGWMVIERETGRSRAAITKKIARNFGGGGITRGSYSLAAACEETGYHTTQLKRSAKALNLRWQRTGKGGDYLISAEQLEDMAAWLCHDFWCLRLHLYGCVNCGTDTQPHRQFGLCTRCYWKIRRFAIGLGLPFTQPDLLALVSDLAKIEKTFFLETMSARIERGKAPGKHDLTQIAEILG